MENHGSDAFINIFGSHNKYGELNVTSYETPCSVYGCKSSSMSKCHFCMKSYCSEHLHLDLHKLKNMAIINQLKMV